MKVKVYVVDVKLPRWAHRALVFGALPALILGVGALVHAMSVEPFTPGDVLTADSLNSRFSQVAKSIPMVKAWTSYPATVYSSSSTGTVSATTSATYRRVGDTIEVNINSEFTACTTDGQLRWSLPPGITPDYAKLPVTFALIGYGTLLPSYGLLVYAQEVGTNYIAVDYVGSAGGGMGCTGPSANPLQTVRLAFAFPVVGWTVWGE